MDSTSCCDVLLTASPMRALRYSFFSITRVINASHGSHEILERQSHNKLVRRPFVSRSLKRRNEINVRFYFCQGVADGLTDSTGRVKHEGFGSFKTCQAQDSICLCRVHKEKNHVGICFELVKRA